MRRRRARGGVRTLLPRGRGWPGSTRVVRTTVNDPDPTTVAIVAGLDRAMSAGMNSHTGSILDGPGSSMHHKYTGYLSGTPAIPTQGRVASLLHRPATLLPGTSGPVVGTSRSVADVLADAGPGTTSL